MSNISDEPLDSEQLVDLGIVGAVTRDDWILVLEREAPQADLNTNNGFDVRAVTLRTASGRTLTSYGHCVLKLQVPPIEDAARVTFQVVDVRHPILSVAMLVANGYRVPLRGQEAVLSTAGGAFAPLTRIRGLWCLLVWIINSRDFLLVESGAASHVCPPAWAHRTSPENVQFQSLTKMTELGDAPLVEENGNDNMNDSENGNAAVKNTPTPSSAPSHDDPCDCHEEL